MDSKENNIIGMPAGSVPLASSLHEFKSSAVESAYKDLEQSFKGATKGIGLLSEIPFLKDKLISLMHPVSKPIRLMRYKTGYYYLRKLSRPERKAFYKSYYAQVQEIPVRDWLSSSFNDLEDFLGCSFVWEYTSLGHGFWSSIATRARWITESAPLSSDHMFDAWLKNNKL